jgi:type II secretory ATPase GspE/PulE/Tfp pilus assembly ATPase PilB-like protein
MAQRLFTTGQMADLLGTNDGAVGHWIQKGWMPFRRLPDGSVRISEKDLIVFLKDRGVDISEIMAKVADSEPEQAIAEAPPEAPEAVEESAPVGAPSPEPDAPEAPREDYPLTAASPPEADPAAQVADAILCDAVAKNVSDIHLGCQPDGLSLRVRIDGVMHDRANFKRRLPKALAPRLIEHFKTLAGLGPSRAVRPVTERFRHSVDGSEREFRLAVCPGVVGESLVIHLLDGDRPPGLSQLGFEPDDLSLVRRLLCQPCGMVLVSGLPGSGRGATLQAMLAGAHTPGRSVAVLERRTAVRLEGVHRCRANPEEGFTSADALRALADQDSDVIVVEQIADRASAAAAVAAGLDGRLVLASVLAGSPADAVAMMLESSPPWELAPLLLAVIAQQTVRRICPDCREQIGASEDLLAELGLRPADVEGPVYRGAGCDKCSQTGFAGRTGVFSLLHVDEAVAASLRGSGPGGNVDPSEVVAGMGTLAQAGLAKLRAGIVSLEELARALPRVT